MKCPRMVSLVALSFMALTAFGASSAWATTLEVGGVTQNQSVAITASYKQGTSAVTRTTGGLFANTCLTSHLAAATTSPFTRSRMTAPISSLSFTNCVEEPVKVDIKGSLMIEWISGTTNGTAFFENTEVTEPSPFGTATCSFGAGTDIGILTGASSGNHAILDVNAIVNCGLIPSMVWEATYVITSPTGLGVVS